jgi:outer membrane PBP1 activator LpoA protein
LNIVDNILDRNLYFWGLAIEAEARQTAQIIAPKNFDKIIIVRTNSGLSKRLQVAFDDEWHRLSSTPIETLEFAEDPLLLNGITDLNNTAIFLAMDADKAHLLKPYLPNKVPVYATSRVFNGNSDTLTNFDLDGIHFVDMPWLLQADHPAVMTYPHSSPPLSADSERLYALGIDAFRIAQLLIKGNVTNALPLDGVSGQIQLRGHSFQRTSIPAVFDQGSATLNDIPITRHTDFPEPTVKNLN